MNNFFPALEGGISGNPSEEFAAPSSKDQLYPKFGIENVNGQVQNGNNMVVQD